MRTIIAYEQRQLNVVEVCEDFDWDENRLRALRAVYPKQQDGNEHMLYASDHWLSYYVGALWLKEGEEALLIKSKLEDNTDQEVHILKMLEEALIDPAAVRKAGEMGGELYDIHFDQKPILIEGVQDNLTPLLVARFLAVMQDLVRKGLKKGYRRKTTSLRNRVKGKVLVAANIKASASRPVQNRMICSFDEFGFDCPENRYLKKALTFVQRYLAKHDSPGMRSLMDYIRPAFASVPDEIDPRTRFSARKDPIYKEYGKALHLARQLMRRFGYSLKEAAKRPNSTPPYWIDMSKLFELFVLGKLRIAFGAHVHFQFKADGSNYLDFLVDHPEHKLVVDAKYKPYGSNNVSTEDIRQIAGYARHKEVYSKLDPKTENDQPPYPLINCLVVYPSMDAKTENDQPPYPLINCLVVYPSMDAKTENDKPPYPQIDCLIIYPSIQDKDKDVDLTKWKGDESTACKQVYKQVYKVGIKLPEIEIKS